MAPGALSGRVRYRRGEGPALLIDADARQYHGPAGLKPLADSISGTVRRQEFLMVPAADWPAEARPRANRSRWRACNGSPGWSPARACCPGFDPSAKYRLSKWPQTEREFPQHFRIATAMMKAPATLAEIAEGSGVGIEEVTDFVNANLATGYAEAWREPEPEPEPQKPAACSGACAGAERTPGSRGGFTIAE